MDFIITRFCGASNEAFDCLKEIIKKSKEKKKVIFIDELSWMDTKGSELISALESFWNGWVTARKEKDAILIGCASATYWMMDKRKVEVAEREKTPPEVGETSKRPSMGVDDYNDGG